LFLFIDNVDLKNNNRNIIESQSEFSECRIAAINLFQEDLVKPWNYLWYCHENTPTSLLPPFQRAEGAMARYTSVLGRPCAHCSTRTLVTRCCRP